MPLIQWIMQNLNQPRTPALVGGSAIVSQEFFIKGSGGAVADGTATVSSSINPADVLVGGSAFYGMIANITGAGGVKTSGSADVTTSKINRKRIKHSVGDTVYDSCNKPWVVISFIYDTLDEPVYNVASGYDFKQKEESDLKNQPVYVYGDGFLGSPVANMPVFDGRRILSFEREDIFDSLYERAKSGLNSLKTRSLINAPVFSGQRILRISEVFETKDFTSKIEKLRQASNNLPVYSGRREIKSSEKEEPVITGFRLPPIANLPVYSGRREIKQ